MKQSKTYKELNTIYCYIDLAQKDWGTYDRLKLNAIFRKDIKNYCKSNGVNIKILELGGGGGGAETLLDIFRFLWQNKGIIGLLVSVPRAIAWIYSQIIKKIEGLLEQKKPSIYISFEFRLDDDYTDVEIKELNKIIPEKLTSLIMISDDLINTLTKKNSAFLFDRSFRASVACQSYWIQYSIRNKKWNNVNKFRLLRLFKAIKIRSSFYSSFDFEKWVLISRTDGWTEISKNAKVSSTGRTYYLIVSNKLLKDYL